ncbi:hypothetical protein CYG49_05010 [Candidatus Saccharibacteria bacterium]|nr:MAG: hypothetical protein CYG49_05010 [Candidatus Saccharibacteria bacterium]
MINLLPDETKKHIRAARMNVILQRYLVLVGIVFVLVVLVFAAGYYITIRERMTAKRELESYTQDGTKFATVDKESKQFAKNLTTAKDILSAEIVFSDLIFDITKTLPSGTILTTLNLSTEVESNQMTISARTKTTDGPLKLKAALEESELFKDVSILSIINPDPSRQVESQIERTYPTGVTLKAVFTKSSTPTDKKMTTPAGGR